jgi:hypothetical protein
VNYYDLDMVLACLQTLMSWKPDPQYQAAEVVEPLKVEDDEVLRMPA